MRAIQLFGSFRQSFGCPEQITCSFMVLGSGCLLDPTGKHKGFMRWQNTDLREISTDSLLKGQ